MKQLYLNNKAFTLAEVLITLGIIGIVAQMTIPTLVKNTQNKEYTVMLQKCWSDSQQFFKMYMAEQGVSSLDDANFSDVNVLDAAVRKYFKVIKSCKDVSDTSCMITYSFLSKKGSTTEFDIYAGSGYYAYSFILTDGMEIQYQIDYPCGAAPYPTSKVQKYCGFVAVDTNGPKPPNKLGRDLHVGYMINQDGNLIPAYGVDYQYATFGNLNRYWRNYLSACGTPGSSDLTNGGAGVSGFCIPRIMENGWQMDY